MLIPFYKKGVKEAGCDEVGRGCLAGPVVAAVVILPPDYFNSKLNDSKKLSVATREKLKPEIIQNAIDYGIGEASNIEIDGVNILNATFLAMHRAIEKLIIPPEFLIIDGNRFLAYREIPFKCIVKGDAKYMSIAAASILAKTYRDEVMKDLSVRFPGYGWERNAGYPTEFHRQSIREFGITDYHRKTFRLIDPQTKLFDRSS
jgi:ribonuclease HII